MFQRCGITPHGLLGHANLVVTSAIDHAGPELSTKEIQRPSERSTGMLLIEFGPEKAEQSIPTVKPARRGNGEIRQ